ncbi:MAG: hypothetical protein JJU46_09950 [Balneolaceae bacterium]|nr:hypothetical protein [Balneolaceae bacterium]MCH8549448.1 hypothetical protein [Balneolaceae bacterium]
MIKGRSVPFEIPNVNHGIVVVKGLLHIREAEIVLEFDQRDGFTQIFKSDLKEVALSYSDLESVKLEKKLFRTRIIILANSMKILKDIPGADQGKVVLKVKRKDRKAAEEAISKAALMLSEQKLRDLDDTD